MAIEYETGGVEYLIECPGAPMQTLPQDIFYFRSLVKRKGHAGDYYTIPYVGKPHLAATSDLALAHAKAWLDGNGNQLPN